jgi:hypothetical protein
MPNYTGEPGNIVPQPTTGITDSTDATPIVIHAIAHGLADRQAVSIKGHQTNTNANGVWSAHLIDPDHFSLLTSVGTGAGAGGATGTVQGLSLGAFTEINDAPAPTAVALNAPPMANADEIAAIAEWTGAWKLVAMIPFSRDDGSPASNPSSWDAFALAANNVYTALTGATVWTPGGLYINPGDILEIDVDATAGLISIANVVVNVGFALFGSFYAPGAAPPAATKIAASGHGLFASQTSFMQKVSCKGRYTNVSGTQQFCAVNLRATVNDHVNTAAINMLGDYKVLFKLYRQTGMPQ